MTVLLVLKALLPVLHEEMSDVLLIDDAGDFEKFAFPDDNLGNLLCSLKACIAS